MRVMAKYVPVAVLLFCAFSTIQASQRIPNSAVPRRVMEAIQNYAPGAQLIEARFSDDRIYRRIFTCTYFRNLHLGTIKLTYRGQLLDIDESLVIDDVPPNVRKVIRRETKGGLIKSIRLDALYGRVVYNVKAYYGNSTNIQISLTITSSGHIVERKVSHGLLPF
ncbi:MAG: hypothetical protein JO232_18900 [Verrucomicrobia bacterium]|nr:hypothetical protein [Verrucomicrobiota bacterium]